MKKEITYGEKLYKKLSIRDYSGSDSDEYAQELGTMYLHIGEELFSLLEEAEEKSKKLIIIEPDIEGEYDFYTKEDIGLL